MRIELNKSVLAGALTALGKLVSRISPVEAYRCIEVRAQENVLHFRTNDITESLDFTMEAETEGDFVKVVSFEDFRSAVRNCRNKSIVLEVEEKLFRVDTAELAVSNCEFPEVRYIPPEAKSESLPDNFLGLLNTAAPIVNRSEYRKVLQGINLSRDGITTTNGKELFHAPVPLDVEDMTLPFPLALMATKATGAGKLTHWRTKNGDYFQIRIASWTWTGKAIEGQYPNWKSIMPEEKSLTHAVTITPDHAEQLKIWLKLVPDDLPNNSMALSRNSNLLHLRSQQGMETDIPAEFSGEWQDYQLLVNRNVLQRLLSEGHTRIGCPTGRIPLLATGGIGQYIAMPLCQKTPEPVTTPVTESATEHPHTNDQKESKTMIDTNTTIVSAPVQTVARNNETIESSPMEELTASIEAFKLKLKAISDESNALSRKVREVALAQKQKERDFVLARRAIERIRMAI